MDESHTNLGPFTSHISVNTLSQQEFEALFDEAAMGIITVNPKGDIVMVNRFALGQFGYEREELLGKKIEVLIPVRYQKKHVAHRDGYHNNNPHQRPMGAELDLCALRKDKSEFPVEVSLSTYTNKLGSFSIAFIIDITARKASENALLRLNEELERKVEVRTQSLSEALAREQELGELKSRFVSMASHEFRTPLSTILSSAYLVSKYEHTDDQQKRDKHIQRIVSSVNMLTDILNDFLSVGRMEEGNIQVRPMTIDIHPWMTEIVSELQQALKAGQHIQYVHHGSGNVLTDPSLLKHIVQNLISNAGKFSPDGAAIRVNTNITPEEFTLSVSDTGIGISREDQEHLFERFFRGANALNIQGTGLGLHIVAKYAELMQGTITCHSVLDEGTTFTIVFKMIP